MDWTLLYLYLIMWLLCWTFITTGSEQENISLRKTIVFSGFLSLGVVFALLCTFLLAAKIFWSTMTQELDQTLLLFLLEVIKNKAYGLTVTSAGTLL